MQKSLFEIPQLNEAPKPPLQQCSVSRSTLLFGDCLIESDKIESGSVDLILTDLPYGTVKGIEYPNKNRVDYDTTAKWDTTIDTNKIYEIANRILRKNGKMILFAQQPFTTELINKQIPNLPLNYVCIWLKDNFANPLFVNKACVGYYEDILLFSKNNETDLIHPLRNYAKNIVDYIGLKQSEIQTKIQTGKIHFLGAEKSTQFSLLKNEVYDKLINVFGIDKMQGFKPFAELKEIDEQFKNEYASTFNLWNGNKYKSNVFEYKKEYNGEHPTQKPVLLLEDLIKTFSNENDLVVDLTMGSGSTGVACRNTNRHFIGIEKDEKYFEIAVSRVSAYCG
jgi:site-specific DNA-methyltransferase (adenine-specific)